MKNGKATNGKMEKKNNKTFLQLNSVALLGINIDCVYSMIGFKTAMASMPKKAISIYSLK